MKYLVILLLLVACEVCYAQVGLPEISPSSRTVEKIGYTTFTIAYGKPFARGRKIFGDVVPYNRLWRTGAGPCTVLAFDTPVVIDNRTVPAGAYALLTIPGESQWTVLLNSDTARRYGDPSEYNQKTEVISFKVVPSKAGRYHEALTLSLDIVMFDAVLYLAWENTQLSFPIQTQSIGKARVAIDQALRAHPNDAEVLSQAAWFYYFNNLDQRQALAWVDKALALGEDRWLLRQRFDILERMERYSDAAKAAERGVAFLKSTKPAAWEESVHDYEERMKRWPKR